MLDNGLAPSTCASRRDEERRPSWQRTHSKRTRTQSEQTRNPSRQTLTRSKQTLTPSKLDSNAASQRRTIRTAGAAGAACVYAELSHAIVGAAIEVHRHVGPGQLESVYQRALASELARRRIPARAQVPIEMLYKGDKVGDFFADFIVDAKIVVELKATDRRTAPTSRRCCRTCARPS